MCRHRLSVSAQDERRQIVLRPAAAFAVPILPEQRLAISHAPSRHGMIDLGGYLGWCETPCAICSRLGH